jgi:hypothetical protein
MEAFLLVECKAPEVSITQNVFDQIARYNLKLNAQYLMVTNGLNNYFCQMDFENEKYIFLKNFLLLHYKYFEKNSSSHIKLEWSKIVRAVFTI